MVYGQLKFKAHLLYIYMQDEEGHEGRRALERLEARRAAKRRGGLFQNLSLSLFPPALFPWPCAAMALPTSWDPALAPSDTDTLSSSTTPSLSACFRLCFLPFLDLQLLPRALHTTYHHTPRAPGRPSLSGLCPSLFLAPLPPTPPRVLN